MEDEFDIKFIFGKFLFYSFMNWNVKFKEVGWLIKLFIRFSLRYFKYKLLFIEEKFKY